MVRDSPSSTGSRARSTGTSGKTSSASGSGTKDSRTAVGVAEGDRSAKGEDGGVK